MTHRRRRRVPYGPLAMIVIGLALAGFVALADDEFGVRDLGYLAAACWVALGAYGWIHQDDRRNDDHDRT